MHQIAELSAPAGHRIAGVPAAVPPAHDQHPLGAAYLRALRLRDRTWTLHALAPHEVRVARYVLVHPGQAPASRLNQAQSLIAREGWCETLATVDDTATTPPLLRPQLSRLISAIRHGDLHGIVTVSVTDIDAVPGIYTNVLAEIRAGGGFLALARDETDI
ncbi:hypothetical protein ACWGJ2_40155 [Streptomyces sp. NPDC054796]